MKTTQILKNSSHFVGYKVVGKMSTNHDGEREVYRVKDADGKDVALVVYNLKCPLYHCQRMSRKRVPDFIEEIKICSELKNKCFPKIISRGIEKVGTERFGWVAQEFINGNSLANEIEMLGCLSLTDTIAIAKQLTVALRELSEHRGGGGHYNIRPENVIVDYDKEELKDVYIVGMANAGMSFHGKPPFKDDNLSNLYRAPETIKGIFNQTSDVYSIGMLMLVMMLGKAMFDRMGKKYVFPTGESTIDEGFKNHKWKEPLEWNKEIWDCANDFISTAARLVLQKVTATSTFTRIPTMQKLLTYIIMLEKRSIKATTITEGTTSKDDAMSNGLTTLTGRSKEKVDFSDFKQSPSHKGLDEVAGMYDLKSVLRRNFVDIVKNRQMARMYGITPPNGILLYGAPGCGKTFVAEKAAQESGLKYKVINPSDFGSIYIHGSQSKIAETFKEAEKNAPMILIFDEFDAIAPKRDADNNNQANEVNEILTQLNNCASKGIFVLATTNRPDMIDAACLRAGRMDEKFYVGLPDTDARKEIFAMELKKRPCDSDIDLELLGNETSDFTCGDISYIVKETARRCFDEAIHNGDGNAVPLTTEKLLEVAKATIPSVSPKDIRLYQELKDKMEHRDKENKSRGRVGFSTNA